MAGMARRIVDRDVAAACREDEGEVGEARDEIDEAEPGHGAAHEVVGQDRLQRRPRLGEIVPLPEGRPWQDDQKEPDLEEERDVDESADQSPTLETDPS
jgi:hypothetical protein